MRENSENICPRCGMAFACGAGSREGCWCMELPSLLPVAENSRCLCPDCLTLEIKEKLKREPGKIMPHLKQNAAKMASVHTPLRPGLDYYINDEGNWVFTTFFHLKKGYCCKNGCQHCPYGFKKTGK